MSNSESEFEMQVSPPRAKHIFECPCGFVCTKVFSIKRHQVDACAKYSGIMRRKSPKGKFRCHCATEFAHRGSLSRHLESKMCVQPQTPLKCHCGASFSKLAGLRRHETSNKCTKHKQKKFVAPPTPPEAHAQICPPVQPLNQVRKDVRKPARPRLRIRIFRPPGEYPPSVHGIIAETLDTLELGVYSEMQRILALVDPVKDIAQAVVGVVRTQVFTVLTREAPRALQTGVEFESAVAWLARDLMEALYPALYDALRTLELDVLVPVTAALADFLESVLGAMIAKTLERLMEQKGFAHLDYIEPVGPGRIAPPVQPLSSS